MSLEIIFLHTLRPLTEFCANGNLRKFAQNSALELCAKKTEFCAKEWNFAQNRNFSQKIKFFTGLHAQKKLHTTQIFLTIG
jgi:hypothetical protein